MLSLPTSPTPARWTPGWKVSTLSCTLPGSSFEGPFEGILHANIEGTYHVFDAARRAGVRRIVYASSSRAVGFTPVRSPDRYRRPSADESVRAGEHLDVTSLSEDEPVLLFDAEGDGQVLSWFIDEPLDLSTPPGLEWMTPGQLDGYYLLYHPTSDEP